MNYVLRGIRMKHYILIGLVIGIVLISGCVQQKPSEEWAPPTEKAAEVPEEGVTPEKPVEEPKLEIKYCPTENLPEGWSVNKIYPPDTSPSEYLKIDNILPIKTQSTDYSIIGEKARRLCQVWEYSTLDDAKKVFDIKKVRGDKCWGIQTF